jgi:hypothetical protein
MRLEAVVLKPLIPMTQGAGYKAQTACRFRARDTLLCHPVAEVKDDPAGTVFRLAAVPLASRSASAR